MINRYLITDGKADVNCTVISVVPILTNEAKIPVAIPAFLIPVPVL